MATRKTKSKSDSMTASEKKKVVDRVREVGSIVVEDPEISEMTVRVIGTSPIMPKSFGGLALEGLAEIQVKTAGNKSPKVARTKERIKAEIADCFYFTPDGLVSVPAINIKNAMVDGLKLYNNKLFKTELTRLFWVNGIKSTYWEQIPLEFKAKDQVNRCDIVRVGPQKVPDFRFRPSFNEWALTFRVSFYRTHISEESIISAINWAGFSCGLLEQRPQKGGNFGKFEIDRKTMSQPNYERKLIATKYKKVKPHLDLPANTPESFMNQGKSVRKKIKVS